MKPPTYTRKTFSDMIMKRVANDTSGEGYMVHIIEYCELHMIPAEQIQYLISQDLKEKLRVEGIIRNTVRDNTDD